MFSLVFSECEGICHEALFINAFVFIYLKDRETEFFHPVFHFPVPETPWAGLGHKNPELRPSLPCSGRDPNTFAVTNASQDAHLQEAGLESTARNRTWAL